jgi:hypothetical protein
MRVEGLPRLTVGEHRSSWECTVPWASERTRSYTSRCIPVRVTVQSCMSQPLHGRAAAAREPCRAALPQRAEPPPGAPSTGQTATKGGGAARGWLGPPSCHAPAAAAAAAAAQLSAALFRRRCTSTRGLGSASTSSRSGPPPGSALRPEEGPSSLRPPPRLPACAFAFCYRRCAGALSPDRLSPAISRSRARPGALRLAGHLRPPTCPTM